MKIEVNLFATLTKYNVAEGGGKTLYVPMEEGSTILELMETLEVPREEVKLRFLNGKAAKEDALLSDGDRLGLFPPVGGG